MQQWCCSSLMTACQRLASVTPPRLLLLSSMAPKQLCASTSMCTSNTCHAASSAASKQVTSWQFHSRHADQSIGQLLATLRSHVQHQGRVNSSVSQSQLPHVPFRNLAYSTQHATQHAASCMSRLRTTPSEGAWRHSAASMAAKHSGETSSASQSKASVFCNRLSPY